MACRTQSWEAEDSLAADSACFAEAIVQGTRHDLGVRSRVGIDVAVGCASGLEDSQVVGHIHMAAAEHTDQADVAHACSRESSSALVSRLGCCSAHERWILDTCPSPV